MFEACGLIRRRLKVQEHE
ncbi:MAG: hypothetical protein ACRC8E_12525 [Plesiomonas shigelloides]